MFDFGRNRLVYCDVSVFAPPQNVDKLPAPRFLISEVDDDRCAERVAVGESFSQSVCPAVESLQTGRQIARSDNRLSLDLRPVAAALGGRHPGLSATSPAVPPALPLESSDYAHRR